MALALTPAPAPRPSPSRRRSGVHRRASRWLANAPLHPAGGRRGSKATGCLFRPLPASVVVETSTEPTTLVRRSVRQGEPAVADVVDCYGGLTLLRLTFSQTRHQLGARRGRRGMPRAGQGWPATDVVAGRGAIRLGIPLWPRWATPGSASGFGSDSGLWALGSGPELRASNSRLLAHGRARGRFAYPACSGCASRKARMRGTSTSWRSSST